MNFSFFPRDKQFWLYHSSSLFFTLVITLSSTYLYGSWSNKTFVDTLAWILPYTFAVLGFRWLYRKRQWQEVSMGKLIPVVLLYGTIAGALIAALALIMVLPFFWNSIVAEHLANQREFVPHIYLFRVIVGGALQNQLFVCAWAFIYISVTSNRRIKETEIVTLRLQNSLKEAQISSLSNQLNPHFLFNSLNNIRFMMHENAQLADHMIVALSEILRYSLESSKHEKVSLSQEIAIIERYIAIVKIQMEDRLHFTMEIPDAMASCQLPPMVLQMLVENAIKHGLDQLQQGGTLRVQAAQEGTQLVLSVANDQPADRKPQDGMGIGLHNIRQRLQLLYGDKASLSIAQDPTQFTVSIKLPKEIRL
jgi:sensor histidine kinase YesM